MRFTSRELRNWLMSIPEYVVMADMGIVVPPPDDDTLLYPHRSHTCINGLIDKINANGVKHVTGKDWDKLMSVIERDKPRQRHEPIDALAEEIANGGTECMAIGRPSAPAYRVRYKHRRLAIAHTIQELMGVD